MTVRMAKVRVKSTIWKWSFAGTVDKGEPWMKLIRFNAAAEPGFENSV